MSIESQFYEARRRQSFIDRRQSLQIESEIGKRNRQTEHQSLHIPVRLIHQDNKQEQCTKVPKRRNKLYNSDLSLFQRSRDIYP